MSGSSPAPQFLTRQLLDCFGRGDLAQLEILATQGTRHHPANGFFWKALGVALMMQAKAGARAAFETAARLMPRDGEVWANLGTLLHREMQLDAARSAFETALALTPGNPVFHTNFGNLLLDLDDAEAAAAAHGRALQVNPDFAEAYLNRAYALGRQPWHLDAALADYRAALQLQPGLLAAWDGFLFTLNYQPGLPPGAMRAAAERYGEIVRAAVPPQLPHLGAADPERRLSVGFVSGDLRGHVVGRALSAVLPAIDRGSFRLVAYSNNPKEDALSLELKAGFDLWHRVDRLDDAALAALIRADGIDLLVDLAGHTRHNRLPVFAHKPAPVQMSWLGYYATTGLREIDYFVGDPIVMPPGEEASFVEQLWRLPEAYYCMPPPVGAPAPLPALANGSVTFGCCNALVKLSAPTIACWSQILCALPAARLFLKTRQLATASVRAELFGRFAQHGVAADRLILAGPSPHDDYLAALRGIDIALDPFPFPGGATTLDCLSLGIPVITKRGDCFIGRQGESLLAALGLDDWIVPDAAAYVVKAVAAAGDLSALAAVRSDIGARLPLSPIFDGRRLAHQLGEAWREMWRIRCRPR